ncbi:hypothetical protein KQX54_013210 [Cotesia glomerata]|uniref:THAP-type domain-containing protein n=1 Tax=Cotesia glomerata TaxID=32391 RepID=A0AAV7HVB7_COTGL|nr:hypothetical protein KQX54_013210 [Cotesia glomerata]
MIICCVKVCRHKKPKDLCKLHRLPKDQKSCKEWVRRIGVEELLYKSLKDLNNVYLCSCHFTKQDYRSNKYLNPGAIPTQFSDDTHPISDEKMEKDIVKKLVSLLIRRECDKVNRKIEMEEIKAANAAKIADLSGKAK